MPWRSLEHDQILSYAHIQQEFRREPCQLRLGFPGRYLTIPFRSLHQTQLGDVPRKRNLGGGDSRFLELLRQLLLREKPAGADQLQNLALAVTFAHTESRSLTAAVLCNGPARAAWIRAFGGQAPSLPRLPEARCRRLS